MPSPTRVVSRASLEVSYVVITEDNPHHVQADLSVNSNLSDFNESLDDASTHHTRNTGLPNKWYARTPTTETFRIEITE